MEPTPETDAGDTFEGRVDELSALFGAWAPGAIANADLSFATRPEAVESPKRLRVQRYVDHAVGLLVAARALHPDAAEEKLRAAAARAGVAVFVLARALVEPLTPRAESAGGGTLPHHGPVARSGRRQAPRRRGRPHAVERLSAHPS